MRWLSIISLALLLSACGLTPQGDAFRAGVATQGATVADNALENAEWAICNAASIGSIMRRYGQDTELSEAYTTLCVPSRAAVRKLLEGARAKGQAEAADAPP